MAFARPSYGSSSICAPGESALKCATARSATARPTTRCTTVAKKQRSSALRRLLSVSQFCSLLIGLTATLLSQQPNHAEAFLWPVCTNSVSTFVPANGNGLGTLVMPPDDCRLRFYVGGVYSTRSVIYMSTLLPTPGCGYICGNVVDVAFQGGLEILAVGVGTLTFTAPIQFLAGDSVAFTVQAMTINSVGCEYQLSSAFLIIK